jgi:uncharacterized membrane protein
VIHKRKSKKSKHTDTDKTPGGGMRRDLPTAAIALAGLMLTVGLTVVALTTSDLPYCSAGSGCDVVQNSRWSVLLGLPLAAWGAALYAVILFAAVGIRSGEKRWRLLTLTTSAGALVSLYLTGVSIWEIEATCAYCLVSLFLITALWLLTWRGPPPAGAAPRRISAALVSVGLVALLHFHYAGVFDPAAGPEEPYLQALAEHLNASGARFYGAYWCPHCEQQKAAFGASAKRLPYIECSPRGRGGPVATDCLAEEIKNYPTWLIDGNRFERTMTPEQLARYSGYRQPSGD